MTAMPMHVPCITNILSLPHVDSHKSDRLMGRYMFDSKSVVVAFC